MDNKIRWSAKAADNLESIFTFIAQDSAFYASITAQKIFKLIENLSIFPESGRIVPELNNSEISEIIYKSYRIVYRLKNDMIEIAAISHSARKEINL
ncbi:MAG: type II toxin-antitoxin system RelE/ParE family toxin [Candidatus Kapabacteria bacterium]|nr:type II toxin-antitoxin system RelE/ParE family toxin [Candidatus Kapabacteria bacterium]